MKKIFLFITILTFVSCKKDRLKDDLEILIGTWEWQNTEVKNQCAGYWQINDLNPTTEGESYQLRIYKKARIEFLRNDEVFESYSFTIKSTEIPDGIVESNKKIKIYLNLGEEQTLFVISGTTKSMGFYFFPFINYMKDGCQYYCDNYFKKIP